MTDFSSIVQTAVRRDRQSRMGLMVGTVMEAADGSAVVNFGRSESVTIPTGGREVFQGQNLLVASVDGVLLPQAGAAVQVGTPNPDVETIL